ASPADRSSGQRVRPPERGEGDYLVTRRMVLAGTGFRTDHRSHLEAHQLFDRPVIRLDLVDPRFYHLDTALAVLSDDEIMYYPRAFAPASRRLRDLFPDEILANPEDAEGFGLNAVSDGVRLGEVLALGVESVASRRASKP
ncbi:MAG: hypothetical protein ACRDTT_23330, partial [Pseudonocardiaceae bacterium]